MGMKEFEEREKVVMWNGFDRWEYKVGMKMGMNGLVGTRQMGQMEGIMGDVMMETRAFIHLWRHDTRVMNRWITLLGQLRSGHSQYK